MKQSIQRFSKVDIPPKAQLELTQKRQNQKKYQPIECISGRSSRCVLMTTTRRLSRVKHRRNKLEAIVATKPLLIRLQTPRKELRTRSVIRLTMHSEGGLWKHWIRKRSFSNSLSFTSTSKNWEIRIILRSSISSRDWTLAQLQKTLSWCTITLWAVETYSSRWPMRRSRSTNPNKEWVRQTTNRSW